MPQWRFFLSVLLPFAAGYYLSYLFRTINALISSDLAAELELSAADLGFLTSIYFLTFAAAQLPLGAMLDRYGPRAMQSVLLLIASAGALIFALADHLFGLLIGRALLGIGVSLALMAGFKAIVLFLPPQRLAISNGWLVMLGALGAVTATAPAEMVVQAIGWRGLFAVLASLAAAAALLILLVVPEPPEAARRAETMAARLLDVYRDRRFWRIAPLSAIGVGTSWSLQGLWASPWLRDVEGLNRTEIVAHLGVMAISVAASAMVLGMLADRMRRRGVSNGVLLAATFGVSMTAQAGLLLDWPLPSYLLWSPVAAAGAATVLSFAMLAEYFPKEMSGRANAALNLLHIGAAFLLQSAAGFIIACWPESHGGYPAEAHRAAMACTLVLEIAALLWFAVPPRAPQRVVLTAGRAIGFADARFATLRYRQAVWAQRAGSLPRFATGWDAAAAASALLFVAVAAVLSAAVSRPALAVYVVEAGGDGELTGADAEPGHEAMMHADAADAPPEGIESRQWLSLASRFTHGEALSPPAIARPWPVASSSTGHDDEEGRNAPTRLRTPGFTNIRVEAVERQRRARYRSPRSHYQHGVPPAVRMCAWNLSVIRSLWRFRARHRLARPRAPGRVAVAGRSRNRHGYRAHTASAVASAQMRFMEVSVRRPPSRSLR
jgi:MFS family permease